MLLITLVSNCLGDDVKRYVTGPPGPQGPPGPAGTAGEGVFGSYTIEQIATYVFNIMNGKDTEIQ